MKTQETLDCEYAIFKATKAYGLGVYGGFEVTMGKGYGTERVDFITMNSKEEFRCYEIKVSKSDFGSKAALSFMGDFNFYVMPEELYTIVKNEIPKGIGVYTVGYYQNFPYAEMVKKAERNKEVDRLHLMHCMVRSLSRYESKNWEERKDAYENYKGKYA